MREQILKLIDQERDAQDKKWGEQNHPNFRVYEAKFAQQKDWPNTCLGIPTANEAREACQEAFRTGTGTWGHILIEEVAEAMEECYDDEALKTELIQVAAVCVSWIEAIERRKKNA